MGFTRHGSPESIEPLEFTRDASCTSCHKVVGKMNGKFIRIGNIISINTAKCPACGAEVKSEVTTNV